MPNRFQRIAVRGQRLRVWLVRWLTAIGFKEDYFLIVVSILIGGATGWGAHYFFRLIEYAGHLCYGSDAAVGSDHGGLFGGHAYMLVLLPSVGALLVGIITHYFAGEAKGHGVPEVMDSILRKGGIIRPRVALAKAIASALTIGSGGSAGMEGPIIQIGAAIGSSFGQLLQVTRRHMGVLVGCGVAAGISSIFNAPIAGVLFALEIFLKDFSLRTFSPVVFASVLSCSLTHSLRPGDVGIFEIEWMQHYKYGFGAMELPLYLGLGVVCAATAVAFIKALYFTEDVVEKIRVPAPLKPVMGAVLLGVAGVAYWTLTGGHQVPPFFANGYPVIKQAISEGVFDSTVYLLLAILALKILATCFTLGFGGSGGIFAPSLLMGAAVGGAYGLALHSLGIVEQDNVSAYALVGMAAVVAGTTHAPLTSIVILYELTREPRVILPVMFAAIIATIGAQIMMRDSIYTLKLRRRGVRMGSAVDHTLLKRITMDEVERAPAPIVHVHDPLQKVVDMAADIDTADFVVVDDDGAYQGLIVADDLRTALLQPEAMPLLLAEELLRTGVPTVHPRETLDIVLDKFAHFDVPVLAVSMGGDSQIEGLVTRQAIIARYQRELERQAD